MKVPSHINNILSIMIIWLFFLSLLSVFFCIGAEKKLYSGQKCQSSSNSKKIDIFYAEPEIAYKAIGEITIGYNQGYDVEYLLSKMRSEAAECGADGLILELSRESATGWQINSAKGERVEDLKASRRKKTGIMILYMPN